MEERIRKLYIKAVMKLTDTEMAKFELILKINRKEGLRYLVNTSSILEEEKEELRKYYNL